MENQRADCSTVQAPAFINALEFCPFEGAENTLAIASRDVLSIGSCKFKSEKTDNESYSYRHPKDIVQEYTTLINLRITDVNCIAWSPVSNMKHLPRTLVISAGTKSGGLSTYTADLKKGSEAVENPIDAHEDCVNDIAFEPIEGQELVSVSDDHFCKVWEVATGKLVCSFPLQYPGVSVCWHPEQPGKIMVAELGGRIRFYDISLKQAVLSIDCKKQSLSSADWCWLNHSKIGATAEMEWFLWDITKSAYPLESQQSHSAGCRKIIWSKHHEDVFLTLGRPKNALKVYHLGHRQPILHKIHETSLCASWHRVLPVCAVAGNKAIHFYDIKSLTQF